jgi:glycosyltransferase involved in cell wall biosynthesis
MAAEIETSGGELIDFDAATKSPLRIWLNAARLARLIRAERINLIHAHSRAPAWSARFAARRTGIPFVTTYHGAYNERGRLKRFYNSIMASGDLVIANSLYTQDLVRRRYNTPSARIRVVHCGIDTGRFDPVQVTAARTAAVRARWGAIATDRVVLLAGRLTGWKGQTVLIDAARRLRETGALPSNVCFVLAGSDQGRAGYLATLRRQIAAAGLSETVLLVGHETDMPAAFATAELSVVASTEPETFGLSTAESLAMACPVIATRLGATPEIVSAAPDYDDDDITGWLTPPGDADALAAALAAALALPAEQRVAIAARGREDMVNRFAVAQTQFRTLAVYDELLNTRLERAFDARIGPAIPTDAA